MENGERASTSFDVDLADKIKVVCLKRCLINLKTQPLLLHTLPIVRRLLSCDGQLPGASLTACSFQIEKEDHTLGNALRFFIMKKY